LDGVIAFWNGFG